MSSLFETPPPGQLTFFDYLNGTGWAAARIADSRASAKLTASYLSDAPANLLDAVFEAVSGASEVKCVWDGESRYAERSAMYPFPIASLERLEGLVASTDR
jgi:hypothetical protein